MSSTDEQTILYRLKAFKAYLDGPPPDYNSRDELYGQLMAEAKEKFSDADETVLQKIIRALII